MAKYILSLDQGTTSSRCIIYDKQGNMVSVAQKEFTQIYPKDGWVEHDAMEIWSTQMGVAQEALLKIGCTYKDIEAIGITNQRETTVVWDKETGEPILNDGKPKLFRSPGEGNYIVRLMNSSLSPDDKLSRMIHTFSTTATEIDDFNYQKLGEYKLIQNSEPVVKQLRWTTIDLRDYINKNGGPGESYISIGSNNNIMSIQFLDMTPGDKFKVMFVEPDNEWRTI